MQLIAIILGKIILCLARLRGGSGSALPGFIIEKIYPRFLNSMVSGLSEGVIVVTGTNGKTTTTKIITELLEAHGLAVLTNKTGSNFVRGTVTAVLDKATISGKLPYDIAVFELDEAHAVHFVEQVIPRGVVATNVMRDQMDRFGEIDTTAKLITKVVKSASKWVVLNANDERIAKMSQQTTAKVHWYGHSKELQHSFLTDDELHHSNSTTYTLAGAMEVELIAFDAHTVTTRYHNTKKNYVMPLNGSHNAINLTAALTVLYAVMPNADDEKTAQVVATLEPAFGRGETITLKDGGNVTLQLVKNPGGFAHGLGMLELKHYDVVGMAVNDDYADGRDVSWLWDVDFTLLENTRKVVICGGVRGNDMAVRLKYDGVPTVQPELELDDFVQLINKTTTSFAARQAIIFCTYTAMLKIRADYKKYSNDVYKVRV